MINLKRKTMDQMLLFTFVIPALTLFSVFFIFPSISSIYYSFTDWHGLEKNINFIGLDNYKRIFQDDSFYASVKNTGLIVVIGTTVQNAVALLLALLLHGKLKSKNMLRTIFFLPSVLSPLTIGFVWSYIYNPVDGLLNVFLTKIGMGWMAADWLGDADIALYSIILIMIWQSAGYTMVIYMAGLDSISESYYEAALIDGASVFQRFRNITIPLLGPAITINVLLCVIGGMKTFDLIYATTGGGPGYATETFASLIFTKAFRNSSYGYGAAATVVLFLMIFTISYVLGRVLRKREIEA